MAKVIKEDTVWSVYYGTKLLGTFAREKDAREIANAVNSCSEPIKELM